jgi:hypothetical protein
MLPPFASENAAEVVVPRRCSTFADNSTIYISVKEEWPDYLVVATKSDPDCQFVSTTVDMEIKCGCFSCSSILPNVVGFNLAVHGKTSLISNND